MLIFLLMKVTLSGKTSSRKSGEIFDESFSCRKFSLTNTFTRRSTDFKNIKNTKLVQ